MNPKTAELLNLLLWSADLLARPTVRNLTDSYEAWAYRQGLSRQLGRLEKKGLLENGSKDDDRIYRLTEHGRLSVLGGRDPEKQWARNWDGRWRLVLFDIPEVHGAQREKLRRYLRSRFFGCLQGSVWVSPDPLTMERETLASGAINVNSLILLEGNPCAGEKNIDLVSGAWDFEAINGGYTNHLEVLEQFPDESLSDPGAARRLQRWAAAEREAWLAAVSKDPLLPRALLPEEYQGSRVWRRRIQVLRAAGELLQTFKM